MSDRPTIDYQKAITRPLEQQWNVSIRFVYLCLFEIQSLPPGFLLFMSISLNDLDLKPSDPEYPRS
jgi:hypothetical protein